MADHDHGGPNEVAKKKRGRPARPPSERNCTIYERVRLDGESQEKAAAERAVTRQRIAEIVAQVEAWIAAHPTHELAQKMRVRCGKRWETLWLEAIAFFSRSREDRQIKKERVRCAAAGEIVTTISEVTTRQQNGDPRFLAARATSCRTRRSAVDASLFCRHRPWLSPGRSR